MTCYRQRNPRDLEPHYSRHIEAMTAEGLHSKGDIAAELAARDQEIERLRNACEYICNVWNDGADKEEVEWEDLSDAVGACFEALGREQK